MAHQGNPAGPQEESARAESVIPGTYWAQKNTFVDVEEPQEPSRYRRSGMPRRTCSAPPSTSRSASTTSKSSGSVPAMRSEESNSEAIVADEFEEGMHMGGLLPDVNEEVASGQAEDVAVRKSKRPGKAHRDRYKAFCKDFQKRLRRHPEDDIDDIAIPAWLAKDPWLLNKFRADMMAYKEKQAQLAASTPTVAACDSSSSSSSSGRLTMRL